MGLFESIGSAISDVGRGINNAAIAIGNGAENIVQQAKKDVANLGTELSRGEVGKFVGVVGQDIKNVYQGFAQAGYDLVVKGDSKSAGTNFGKATGSAVDVTTIAGTGGLSYVAQRPLGQKVLNAPITDKVTLGFSSDYAKYQHGLTTLRDTAYVSDEDRIGTQQLAVKAAVAAVGTGYAAANSIEAKTLYGVGQAAYKNDGDIIKTITDSLGITQIINGIGNALNPPSVSHVNDPVGLTNPPSIVQNNTNSILLYSSIGLVALYIAKQKRLI